MNKQQAIEEISSKMEKAAMLVSECEDIAKEYGIAFDCEIGGYGMGGYYDGTEGEWNPSSQSC